MAGPFLSFIGQYLCWIGGHDIRRKVKITTLDTFESSTVSNVIDIDLLICDIIILIVVAGKPLFSHIIKSLK